MLKTVRRDLCVNGSQLKKIIDDYKGRLKSLGCIETSKSQVLLINDEEEIIFNCKYVKEADNKKDNVDLFEKNKIKKLKGGKK